jgi:type IV pilus assembly protein PilW
MTMRPLLLHSRRQAGLSLIELMVALALDLVIVLAVASVFSRNSQFRNDIERGNEQLENGRYAMQTLTDDLEMAGYLSTFDPDSALALSGGNKLVVKSAALDPCDTTVANLALEMTYSIQAYDQGTDAPGCISDVKDDTDIVVVRRTSACEAGTAACPWTDGIYLQASQCQDDMDGSAEERYVMGAQGALNKTNYTCTGAAPARQYLVRIYFVAKNDQTNDGIPTLKRAELDEDGAMTIVPIAEGIDDLQLLYGIDGDGDGIPDAYTADPKTFNGCADTACELANSLNIVAVQVGLLARSTTTRNFHVDSKTYSYSNVTVGPIEDNYERRVFEGFVRVMNTASRREQT